MQTTKKLKTAVFICRLMTSSWVKGQTECSTNMYDYAQYVANETPITTIRVSVDIIQNPTDPSATLDATNTCFAACKLLLHPQYLKM